ncbi:MAG: helix-turn-helix domain-containing protein [Ginsengibacter sp.]
MHGDRIRFFRKQKGLSQSAMAAQLFIAPATYSKIETSRTSLVVDMLKKIATVLDVSPLAILNEDPIVVKYSGGPDSNGTITSRIDAETVFHYSKELVDSIIAAKDLEIATLKQSLENRQKLIQQQSSIIEKMINGK